MRDCANETSLPIHIYGPETHMTDIVPLALGLANAQDFPEFDAEHQVEKPVNQLMVGDERKREGRRSISPTPNPQEADQKVTNFTAATRCVVYGLQRRAVQSMLDFDYLCERSKPSVAAIINPFSSMRCEKVSASG